MKNSEKMQHRLRSMRIWPRSRGWKIWCVMMSGSWLICSTTGCASVGQSLGAIAVAETPTQMQSSPSDRLKPLLKADVVYLGETHDRAADHTAQLEILQALHAANPAIAIGLEMFQRPFQPAIDLYLAGDITEAELVEQTEYKQRWGFPWEYYAPILRFAKAKQLPVIALNAPAEVTRKVARQGLDSLTAEDYRYLPDRAQLDISNAHYRKQVAAAFSSHDSHGKFNLDHFFAAQVIWDETMAESVAAFRRTHPQTQVIVLAGQGHVVYGYGIPDRVARRLGNAINQQIVLLNPSQELATEQTPAIADVFWYSQ